AIAGVGAAVGFLASLGSGGSLREQLISAYQSISEHEYRLAGKLYQGLKQIPGLMMIGQDFSAPSRTPTVSFTMKGKTPWQICEHLAKKNICAWDGHFYAIRAIEVLGLLEQGGVTRLGISLYNTEEEVNLTVASVGTL
ncbi:MAG TPA: aminotransferase class V-fold PLP-dependent enzyme, partial [Cyclobacteriaceae bacterium]|nr:aminotransferase class V-fold PLP-dependent enzyme [Cyclobacteriaceae bacterium]